MNMAKIYEVEFITSGAVGYPEENALYYIRDSALEKMAKTMIGRPVYLTHESETPVGYVVDSTKKDNGYYSATLSIFDDETNKCLDEGYSFSSAYFIKDKKENTEINSVIYDFEILDGEYDHIAVVKYPRFNEIKFTKLNSKFTKLNSKEKGGGMKLNFFKGREVKEDKNKATKEKEELIQSSSDKKTDEKTEEFVFLNEKKVPMSTLINLYKEKKENDKNDRVVQISEYRDIDGEKVKLDDLINLYNDMVLNNLSKNHDESKRNEINAPKSFSIFKENIETSLDFKSFYLSLDKREELGREKY